MTEHFVVPPPSEKAIRAYLGRNTINEGLKAAFDTDLPAILRAEVTAALREARGLGWHDNGEGLPSRMVDYLTARYGAAPETPTVGPTGCPQCSAVCNGVRCSGDAGHHDDHYFKMQPERAPTFTREAEAAWTLFCKWWVAKNSDADGMLNTAEDAMRAYLASREGR